GPYATGFCWIAPLLRERLRRVKAYWLTLQTAEDLGNEIVDPKLPDNPDLRSFDIFAPANFFNFKPWAAAVEFILGKGIERIRDHDDALVDSFIEGLDSNRFRVLSPSQKGPRRSTLVFFTHCDSARNPAIHSALAQAGIDVALRGGLLRLSPHLHN